MAEQPDHSERAEKREKDDGAKMARRALLKLGLWVPPAIVATFLLDRPGLAATCGPQQCNPVNPGQCGPASGCGPGSGCAPIVGN